MVCLLIVNHSFAETGPGSAAQLAGYWEVFSPGPLTKNSFETPRGSVVDVRMGAPSGRGGRGGSGDTTRPEKSPVGKVWTSKAIQELLKQHEQDAAKATKPSKLPRLLYNFTEETTAVFEMVETLEFVTDPDMIALYVESEERRKKWFEEKGKELVPDVPPDQLRLLSRLHNVREDSQLDGRPRPRELGRRGCVNVCERHGGQRCADV